MTRQLSRSDGAILIVGILLACAGIGLACWLSWHHLAQSGGWPFAALAMAGGIFLISQTAPRPNPERPT